MNDLSTPAQDTTPNLFLNSSNKGTEPVLVSSIYSWKTPFLIKIQASFTSILASIRLEAF